MMQDRSTVWHRLDLPGHEYARIFSEASKYYLSGTTIFVDKRQFCKLDYLIECDLDWQTLAARISGFVGEKAIEIQIAVDAEKRWTLNGNEVASVENCVDIDFSFSPVTNTLPIRRCALEAGEKAEVCAAWLKFPEFTLETLDQVYEHRGANEYIYESAGGAFTAEAEIETDDFGLVTKYPNLWEIEK